MSSTTPRNRRFLDSCIDAVGAALPSGLALTGLALGAGALVVRSPLLGSCGALAGLAAFLLAAHRAKGYRRQVEGLRDRLRIQRAQSDLANTEFRSRISALEVAAWEVKTLVPVPVPVPEVPPSRPGLRLAAAVLDAAVATTGSLSLAEIAEAARKKNAA